MVRSNERLPGRRRRHVGWSAGVLALLALLAAVVLVGPAAGASADFPAVADSYVDAANPNVNYGAATQIRADASPVVRGYLRFDPSLAAPVTSAKLRVYVNIAHKAGYRVLALADSGWGETSITAANAPAPGASAVAQSGPVIAAGWTEVDVTPLVTGSGPVSLALETTSSTALSMASREAGSAKAPRLLIETGDGSPGDTVPPAIPQNVGASADGPTQVTVDWDQVGDADLAGYRVYRNGSQVASTASTSAVDGGLTADTSYSYTVRAFDAAGNLSSPSAPAAVTTPAAPPGGAGGTFPPVADSYADAGNAGTNYGTSTQLRADASPVIRSYLRFNPTVSGTVTRATLRIHVNIAHSGGFGAFAVANTTWSETGITAANAPAPAATAVDQSGSAGVGFKEVDVTSLVTGSGPVSFALQTTSSTALSMASREAGSAKAPQLVIETGGGTPGDTDPPAVPQDVSATADGPTQVTVDWDPVSDDDLAGYRVFRNGALVASPSSSSAVDAGLTPDTSYTYTVRAIDEAGNLSGASAPATVSTPEGSSGGSAPAAPPMIWAAGVTDTQVVVRWRPSPSADVTAYEVRRGGTRVATVGTTDYTDSGLSRDTAYAYTIVAVDTGGDRSQPSPTANARTKDSTADPVIAAAGDIACDPGYSSFKGGVGAATACHQKKVSDLLIGTDWATVLPLGDNQYYCASLQAFQIAYEPSWGRVKSVSQPIAGNHEYVASNEGRDDVTGCNAATAGAAGYYTYFGAAAGTPGQGWYSYDIGDWHLIALNSECDWIGGCTASSPQGRWLAADLAAHDNLCTLAYFHEPLFTSGRLAEPDIKPFWDQLYAGGVDVILNGHDHIYERFAPQTPTAAANASAGVRQFTIGTGGANHTSLTTTAKNSQVRNASTFGIFRMTLRATGYDFSFVPEAGSSFTDAGTGSCH